MDEIHGESGHFGRNLLLGITAVILLAVTAAAFFIFTFDADRYRPMIQEKLEQALGRPVGMERIFLGWEGGLALKIDGLNLNQSKTSKNSFLNIRSVAVRVSLMPLLRHEVQVSSVIIDNPEITLTRSPSGRILELSEQPVSSSEVSSPAPGKDTPAEGSSAALAFLVESVKIKNGRLHFVDQNPASYSDIDIRQIEAVVSDISPLKPLHFDARASIFGTRQNFSAEGQAGYDVRENGVFLENFSASMELADVDAGKLLASFPALQEVGLAQGMAGHLDFKIERFKMVSGKIRDLEGDFHIGQGTLKTARMPIPASNLDANVNFNADRIILQNLSGNLGTGKFELAGQTELTMPLYQTQFQVSVSGMEFSELTPPPARSSEPYLTGKAGLNLKAAAQGNGAPLITQTVSGNGMLQMDGLVLKNMNVLREILKKLSVVPAIGQSLEKHLPENYNERLRSDDTSFEPIQAPILIQQGIIFFDHALIQSDSLSVLASGRAGINGSVQMNAIVTLDSDLSAALIRGIQELQYLTDPQGRLQIPLVQAQGPKFSLIPDIPYIASKLAVGKGRDVLTQLIQKKTGTADPNAPAAESSSGIEQNVQPSGGTDYRKLKGKDILNQFLQTALQPESGGDSSNSR